ncbi:MAG: hypothetical protein DRJ56_07455 [Thermoprotei archaeon]|nr:MAG: hypothetical protein DRJ56_07455 [Thermoprotei archaeon]
MAMLSRGGSQRTVLDLLWDLPPGTVIEGEYRMLGPGRVSVSRLDRLEWRSRSGFSRLEYVALTGRAGLLRGTVSEYTLLTLLRVVPEHRVWWSGPKVVRVSAEPPVSAR